MKSTILKTTRASFAGAFAIIANAADLQVPAKYAIIQAAVNAAASGDTIHIAPGVYAEQTIIINKNPTLIGQPGTILRAFSGMALSFPGINDYGVGTLGIIRSDVAVSGLTFEGEHLADSPVRDLGGVYFLGASGRVENCRFSGFRGSTLGYNFYCIGVGVANPASLGAGVVDLRVFGCTFADNTRSIELIGDLRTRTQPNETPPCSEPPSPSVTTPSLETGLIPPVVSLASTFKAALAGKWCGTPSPITLV